MLPVSLIVAIVVVIVVVVFVASQMKTSVEVRGNEVILRSLFSSKRYRITEVIESGVPVGSILEYRIYGINLPSKKFGKFQTRYGKATVHCMTPHAVVLKTDKGILIIDDDIFRGRNA